MLNRSPFRWRCQDATPLDLEGARSVWNRVYGLLHLNENIVTFEWSRTRHVEHVSFTGVRVRDDATVPELVDVPAAWIADARVTGDGGPRG